MPKRITPVTILISLCLGGTHSSAMLPKQNSGFTTKELRKKLGKTIGFLVPSARFFYEGLLDLHDVYSKDHSWNELTTIETGCSMNDDYMRIFKEVGAAMHVSPETKIGYSSHLGFWGSPASAGHKTLCLSPSSRVFDFFSPDEHKFIIGHECSHINHNDMHVKGLLNISVPFISYGLLRTYEYFSSKFVKFIQNKYAKDYESASEMLWRLERLNKIISRSWFTHYALNVCLSNTISKYIESRADYEAAQMLNNPEAGISFFNKVQTPGFVELVSNERNEASNKIKQTIFEKAYLSCKNFDRYITDEHPPVNDRIKALAALLSKK
jgi:hypothetical protein